MPYSEGDLHTEILWIVSARLTAGTTIVRGWLEHEVLATHPLGTIRDRDFNVLCRRLTVNRAVLSVLRKLKLAAEDEESVSGTGILPLNGYKHLQQGYPLERKDELVIVPIQRMTNDERDFKAKQYRKMAQGCTEHAEELERYKPPAAPIDHPGGAAMSVS